MKLVLSDPVTWDVELHDSRLAGWNGKAIAQHTCLASAAGIGEQHLAEYTISITVISTRKPQTTTQNHSAADTPGLHHLKLELRELHERKRLRHVLVSQSRKTIISRHKEVVSGNVRRPVKRRFVRLNNRRELVPYFLDIVRDVPPAFQGLSVNIQSCVLRSCSGEHMAVPSTPITTSITMIERDIASRTPAIRETSIWMVNRHKANRLK